MNREKFQNGKCNFFFQSTIVQVIIPLICDYLISIEHCISINCAKHFMSSKAYNKIKSTKHKLKRYSSLK